MKVCKHVEYDWDENGVRVTSGVAVPIFGWSVELQGDVPLLRCSVCGETAALSGVTVVFVNRGGWIDKKAKPEPGVQGPDWDDDEEFDWDDETDDEDIDWTGGFGHGPQGDL